MISADEARSLVSGNTITVTDEYLDKEIRLQAQQKMGQCVLPEVRLTNGQDANLCTLGYTVSFELMYVKNNTPIYGTRIAWLEKY
jgi:hypothetical protein